MSKGVGILLEISNMAAVSDPSWLGYFIVEESGAVALAPLFQSEPLDDVGFESLTCELGWGPLSIQVSHCVIPCLSGVQVHFPTVSLLSCGPIRHLESLEESSRSSVETDISNSFEEGVWVEVLSVNMELNVRLLEELIVIHVFNSESSLSSLLNVESVSCKCKVWMDEPHHLREELLNITLWIVDQFDPSSFSTASEVVFEGSTNVSLFEEGSIDNSI